MTNHNIQRAWWVSVLLLLSLGTLFAQNAGKISGAIHDSRSGEPLVGANVVVVGTNLGSVTDISGNYFILNVPVGKYVVYSSLIGYSKVSQTDVVVNLEKTTNVDFKLSPADVQQNEVVIEAKRPNVEKEKTSTSSIVRADDIQQIAGMHSAADALSLSADVTDGHFRGGRSGEVLYNLQGMGTLNPLDNSNTIDPIMSAVEEVEVVTSGFGAQYGNAQSGVVNISMKEGKSDKWHSYAELRATAPTKKHFGPSPYDVSANPYLQVLMNPANWNLVANDGIVGARLGWDAVNNGYMRMNNDTVMLAQIAYTLYKQLNNNTNRSYGNRPDYSVEVSTGGPLTESTKMFVAMNTNISWPLLPTETPDEKIQAMGNISTDAGSGATFHLSGAFSENKETQFNTSSITGPYLNYLYNMLTGTTTRDRTNMQLGMRYAKAINENTFYEVKLNTLSTRGQIGSRNCVPDSLVGVGYNVYWLARPNTTKAGYMANPASNFNDDKTQTISLDASYTSQVTKAHMINTGIQGNLYLINVDDRSGGQYVNGWSSITQYYAHPLEGSVYVQDKMEFEEMIANIGLRLDAWDMRSSYARLDTVYSRDNSTPILGRLQPRVGFSFPVSENSVFHVNYGAYIQRPSFQYTTQENVNLTGKVTRVPNPALRPQSTNSYDLGITQGIAEGFTLDVSGYYKNVNDLIRQIQFSSGSAIAYTSYINYDYADIRGVQLALTKRRGNLTGSINYTYSVNTGSSASAEATPMVKSILNNNGVIIATDNVNSMPTQEVVLDYDRTHNLIVNLGYIFDEQFGFEVGGVYPLGDLSIAITSTATSGRPFTYKPLSQSNEWMNMRAPAEYNTDLKLSKRIKNVYGVTLTLYAEVFNLFNTKIWNYNYLFASSLTANKDNIIAKYLDSGNYTAADGLLYFMNAPAPFVKGLGVDQSFMLYSNQPRSFWFGVSAEF